MITKQLAHKMLNLLQLVLGRVTLTCEESNSAMRCVQFDRAKKEIKELADLIRENTAKG